MCFRKTYTSLRYAEKADKDTPSFACDLRTFFRARKGGKEVTQLQMDNLYGSMFQAKGASLFWAFGYRFTLITPMGTFTFGRTT